MSWTSFQRHPSLKALSLKTITFSEIGTSIQYGFRRDTIQAMTENQILPEF